jgi:calcineurin-like phosphoesterase family protein
MKGFFVTSDLHIGHANSIKYDNRPFKDLDHMHSYLIKNYNATVPETGTCFFLGDIGMGNTAATKDVITKMHGTKVLVLGNHDKGITTMLDCGFDVVVYGLVMYLAGERVTMSHCPLRGLYREPTDHFSNEKMRGGNWHGESKNNKFTFDDEGQFHLHGHIHSGPNTKGKDKILGRQYDVGVCANHYKPVSFSAIESWITKTVQSGN